MQWTATLIILPLGLLVLLRCWRPSKRLPPGPRGLPLFGNLHQLWTAPWLKFLEWTEIYGPIFRISVCGQDAMVLGTHDVVSELLERRAGNYSDRPRMIVAYELLTGGMVYVFGSNNEMWRKMRKASHEALNNHIAKRYHPLQERESAILLQQLLDDPSQLENHLLRANSSLLISVIYGKKPYKDSFDPVMQAINHGTERIITAAAPGQFLVEYMPWMMKLPKWMCKWRRDAERDYELYSSLFLGLYEDFMVRLKNGDTTNCVAENVHCSPNNADLSKLEKAFLLGTIYAAGSDTTSRQMLWFFVSMILHPEAQRKAQQQIDQVVGRGRPPTFRDIERLPYIRAIIKEVMRWRGFGPLGVPHRTSEDDVYNGMFIPKGTVCIVNTWALDHDKNVYGEDADYFRPERQIVGDKIKEDGHSQWGYGRRVCVGKHVATNSMCIQAARILWAFNIRSDNPPDPDRYIQDGLMIRPELFECSLTPRFPEIKDIIPDIVELENRE